VVVPGAVLVFSAGGRYKHLSDARRAAFRVVRTLTPSARRWPVDALLYGLSASFAAVTAGAAGIPLQRTWGHTALWGYVVATAAAMAASLRRPREGRDEPSRALLAVAVFALTAVVPLVIAAHLRAEGDPGDHAQSEVIIVEEGADALLGGRDPYAEEYLDGPLSDRPLATRVHLPYMPFMLAFGIPRALVGHVAWADARVWFTIVALAVALPSLLQMHTSLHARTRTFQILFALPTGALLIATGGDDIPVLALLLAAAVLAERGETRSAGLVGGLALATKQTSFLVVPFIALAISDGSARRRFLATAGLVGFGLTLPFAAWDLGAFIEDAILFPLGASHGGSAAKTPTVGSLLLDLFPSHRGPITAILVVLILGVVALLLFSGRGSSMSQACMRAGGAFLFACAFAPAARIGYLVYPANLIAWAFAFARATAVREPTAAHAPNLVPDT
jgi:glycosyl transferase family 87